MNYTDTYIRDLTLAQHDCGNIEKLFQKTVLVTGATGLVGSAIVDFLQNLNDTRDAGIKVYMAARNRKKAEERFKNRMDRTDTVFVEYDAVNEVSWEFDADYVIHGASPANPFMYVKYPVETMLANIIGVNNILDYAKRHRVQRVLFISSSEVYGRKQNAEPYRDSEYGYVDILNPRACYPSAKRASETLCASYWSEYQVDNVIVRLGHVFGPTAMLNDVRASSQFFFDVIADRNIIMKSAGSQIRSYCYVVDSVSAILTVLLSGQSGKAYNVSNVLSIVTIREIAEKIAQVSGRKVVFENPSDEERRGYNLMDNSSLDGFSLSALGWRGLFDIDTGVKHTYDIMKGI